MPRTIALEARLWTPAQVAERYQIAEHTLANWRSLGLGPPYLKAGRSVLYRESDLARWEQTRAQTSR